MTGAGFISRPSGLIAAVGAIDTEPGDEIIVSPWTMCASATAILHWNAIPVFADIENDTFNKAIKHWKAQGLNFEKLFYKQEVSKDIPIYNCEKQNHHIDNVLDKQLIAKAKPAILNKYSVKLSVPISNFNRSTGAMLSGEVARRYGHAGLPEDTIHIKFKGTTGQAFGAWVCKGITFEVEGEANDYVGKGLSGGKLIIYPPKAAKKLTQLHQ